MEGRGRNEREDGKSLLTVAEGLKEATYVVSRCLVYVSGSLDVMHNGLRPDAECPGWSENLGVRKRGRGVKNKARGPGLRSRDLWGRSSRKAKQGRGWFL